MNQYQTTQFWNGYSQRERSDQTSLIPDLLKLADTLKDRPIFKEYAEYLSHLSPEHILDLQKKLLEDSDHSFPITIGAATIKADETAWIEKEIKKVIESVTCFCADSIRSGGILKSKFYLSLNHEQQARLRHTVRTSAWAYLDAKSFESDQVNDDLSKWPLFLDCAVDLMIGEEGPLLSEIQLGSQIYPHCHFDFINSYFSRSPSFMERVQAPQDHFLSKRKEMWLRSIELFQNKHGYKNIENIVIDAWAKTENRGRTYKDFAKELNAEFTLLDDIQGRPRLMNISDEKTGIAIYNMPSAFFLDPDAPLFSPYKDVAIEHYPDLGYQDLHDGFESGKILLALNPFFDILNDKALFPLIPQMTEFYLDQSLLLPVCDSHIFSSERGANQELFDWVNKNKNDSVICHRWLEAGMGVHVGAGFSDDDWSALLKIVHKSPERFVFRPRYKMKLTHSLRPLVTCLRDFEGNIETSVCNYLFGRVNPNGLIDNATGGGFVFLAIPSHTSSTSVLSSKTIESRSATLNRLCCFKY